MKVKKQTTFVKQTPAETKKILDFVKRSWGQASYDVKGGELIPILMKYLEEGRAGKSRKELTIEDANLTIKTFEERKEEFNHGETEKGREGYFHPSAIGKCERQVFFEGYATHFTIVPKAGEELLRQYMTFETGTYLGVVIQNLCEMAGVLESREAEVVDDKHKIVGHADAVLKLPTFGRTVLEIKTINARAFSALSVPKPEHVSQASVYGFCLGIKSAIILYCEKDTGRLREFPLRLDFAEIMDTEIAKIRRYHKLKKDNVFPRREHYKKEGFPCSYCPFSSSCYDESVVKALLKKVKAKSEGAV